MGNIAKVSKFAVGCVLCAASLSPAYSASSVRSLGGAGTYSGASNAAAANTVPATTNTGSAAINSARTSSVRAVSGPARVTAIAPGSGANAGSGAGRAATNPSARLSVGSYLSGGKSVSGGSSIKSQNPGSGSNTNINQNVTVLQNQIDSLQRDVNDLQDADSKKYTIIETDRLLGDKQDTLTAGTGIEIANGVISSLVVDGKSVLLQSNGTHIQWKYDDASSRWHDLVQLSDLQGPQGPQGPQGIQGPQGGLPDMTGYSTTQQIMSMVQIAIGAESVNYATAAQGAKADSALQPSAPADGSDYVLVLNNGTGTWFKVAY